MATREAPVSPNVSLSALYLILSREFCFIARRQKQKRTIEWKCEQAFRIWTGCVRIYIGISIPRDRLRIRRTGADIAS